MKPPWNSLPHYRPSDGGGANAQPAALLGRPYFNPVPQRRCSNFSHGEKRILSAIKSYQTYELAARDTKTHIVKRVRHRTVRAKPLVDTFDHELGRW
ncbi:MAG: hypothetical protein WBY01_08955, partial [Pseudolabrys sp.]